MLCNFRREKHLSLMISFFLFLFFFLKEEKYSVFSMLIFRFSLFYLFWKGGETEAGYCPGRSRGEGWWRLLQRRSVPCPKRL